MNKERLTIEFEGSLAIAALIGALNMATGPVMGMFWEAVPHPDDARVQVIRQVLDSPPLETSSDQ